MEALVLEDKKNLIAWNPVRTYLNVIIQIANETALKCMSSIIYIISQSRTINPDLGRKTMQVEINSTSHLFPEHLDQYFAILSIISLLGTCVAFNIECEQSVCANPVKTSFYHFQQLSPSANGSSWICWFTVSEN